MTILSQQGAMQPRLQAAINQVWDESGVKIDVVGKAKTLLKFGRHTALGTSRAMIWSHGVDAATETLLTSDGITHLVSSDDGDTAPIQVEYHTISGSDLTFGVQTVTLTGNTPVALSPSVARVSRLRNVGSVDLAGDVYAYEGGATTDGVPNDLTTVHARIDAGEQQTQKAATSVSAADYWLVTMWHGQLIGSNTARCSLELERRSTTGVWLPTGITMGLGTAGTTGSPTQLDPVTIIPANHDVRVMGLATAASTVVDVYFAGYLASVVN